MKPLTKREKLLLYALAVIAVVAGLVVLVIQPATKRSAELDAAILDKQMSVDSIRVSIAASQGLWPAINEAEAGIAEERKYFLPTLTNNELDAYITGLLQTHGLTALSLAIVRQEAETAEDAPTVSDDIRVYRVNTTARGTMSQFMLLADTVAELDGVRISALTNKQDTVNTPKPTATPRPSRKATPAPLFATPAPTPAEGTYTMDIVFSVLEYAEGASTSIALDRED